MSDDGRLPPSWGPAPGPTPDPGLAGLFPPPDDPTDPYAQPAAYNYPDMEQVLLHLQPK